MNDKVNDDPGSAQAVIARAKEGEELLGSRVAQGEPGTKQPPHDDVRLSASKTVEKLGEIVKQFEGETYEGSMARAAKPGNLNPIAPEDRTIARGPMVLQAAATAAGAIGAARDALAAQLEGDARITSDPRYERDQKVFELGQAGKLGLVAPTEAEQAAAAARSGLPGEAGTLTPKTAEEQVAEDMPRLMAAEKKAATVKGTVIPAGEQEITKKNNGITAEREGRTREEAVARAKASEQEAATRAAIQFKANVPSSSEASDVRAAKPGNEGDFIK